MDWSKLYIAFGAGLLSFLSPCILPLMPAYLCFLTGSSIERLTKDRSAIKTVLPNAILFVLGFSVVFVLLGASATFIGAYLFAKQRIIKIVGGLIIILFGLHTAGLFKIRFLQAEKKVHINEKPIGIFGSFLVGLAFGFGWTPCIGPILGSILVIAASKETVWQGIILLASYSLGLAVPFIITAAALGWAMKILIKIKKYFNIISFITGILLIGIGVWIIFK